MTDSPQTPREKSPKAFRTISEAAGELELPQHVLRFWETKFPQIKPMKRTGGRRFYRPEDVELLNRIKALLHTEGYTIKGVQKLLRQGGVQGLPSAERQLDQETTAPPARGDTPKDTAGTKFPDKNMLITTEIAEEISAAISALERAREELLSARKSS